MRELIDKLFRGALNHRKVVLVFVAIFLVASALCIPAVKINYQFSDYLPESSPSTQALRTLESAFDAPVPNSRVYVEGISLVQAKELSDQFEQIDGVKEVLWLGNIVDTSVPLATYDADTVSAWKADDGYLYQVALDTSKAVSAMDELRSSAEATGASEVALAGEAINTAVPKGLPTLKSSSF